MEGDTSSDSVEHSRSAALRSGRRTCRMVAGRRGGAWRGEGVRARGWKVRKESPISGIHDRLPTPLVGGTLLVVAGAGVILILSTAVGACLPTVETGEAQHARAMVVPLAQPAGIESGTVTVRLDLSSDEAIGVPLRRTARAWVRGPGGRVGEAAALRTVREVLVHDPDLRPWADAVTAAQRRKSEPVWWGPTLAGFKLVGPLALVAAGTCWVACRAAADARALWLVRSGRCGRCGYDQHGLEDDGRPVCPECGAARPQRIWPQRRAA